MSEALGNVSITSEQTHENVTAEANEGAHSLVTHELTSVTTQSIDVLLPQEGVTINSTHYTLGVNEMALSKLARLASKRTHDPVKSIEVTALDSATTFSGVHESETYDPELHRIGLTVPQELTQSVNPNDEFLAQRVEDYLTAGVRRGFLQNMGISIQAARAKYYGRAGLIAAPAVGIAMGYEINGPSVDKWSSATLGLGAAAVIAVAGAAKSMVAGENIEKIRSRGIAWGNRKADQMDVPSLSRQKYGHPLITLSLAEIDALPDIDKIGDDIIEEKDTLGFSQES